MGKRTLYIDGASRGNPGRAAIGVSLADEHGREIESLAQAIGKATNNEAEYRALVRGLELAATRRADEIEIRTDSELLARQLKGSYRVRAGNLKPLWEQARQALGRFKRAAVIVIPRALNRRADALANQALDAEENRAKARSSGPHAALPAGQKLRRDRSPSLHQRGKAGEKITK